MKSLQTSYGKNFLFLILCSVFVFGCAIGTKTGSDVHPNSLDNSAEVPAHKAESANLQETSIANDKAVIDELRKDIPAEKRKENDELKELLNLTGEVKDAPYRIREKFSRLMQRMRDVHRRESQKMRQEYTDAEKKKRTAYQRKADEERKAFNKKKHDREERKEFYDKLDQARKDFFADERDKRNMFNSDMRVREDDFNNLIRDRQQDFNLEIRAYEIRYKEHIKQLEEKKRNRAGDAL